MTDGGTAALREFLVGQYGELKRVLTKRLGSEDLAGDALHETYLRLERPARIGLVLSPKRYLVTIALNIARRRFQRDQRADSLSELDGALGIADETPDALRDVEGRQELEALQEVFNELTPRRRQILFLARVEEMQLRDIAARLEISQRTVEQELKIALMTCGTKLNRQVRKKFGSRSAQVSTSVDGVETASKVVEG